VADNVELVMRFHPVGGEDVFNHIAGVLPVRPFNEALLGPFAQHTGLDWPHLAVLLAWGVIGAAVAIRRFRWDPRPQ
jgi:ABC-2 type transport system permease protein